MTIYDDVVCPACGCFCDDLQVTIDNNQILATGQACHKGDIWFRAEQTLPVEVEATIDGCRVSRQQGIQAVAELLLNARLPLIYGLSQLDVDGQRAACALAEEVGAALDSGSALDPAIAAFPTIGSMGCTWGEVVQRADVIVYWQCEPDEWQPRHRERILDRIQATRSVVVINDIPRGWDFAAIWQLRALVQGRPTTLMPTDRLIRLATTLRTAKYGVIVHETGHPDLVALQALATDINRHTRCRLVSLAGPGHDAGASEVMTWQSGYGRGIGWQRGYPVSAGSEFTAERLLRRGEVDMAMTFGTAEAELSEAARGWLTRLPQVQILIGGRDSTKPQNITPAVRQIALFASVPGIHTAGSIFRSDRVTLPLRKLVPTSLPSPALVVNEVLNAVRSARPARI